MCENSQICSRWGFRPGKVLDPGTPADSVSGMMFYTKGFQFLFSFEQLKIFQESYQALSSAFRPADLFLGLAMVILKHSLQHNVHL